MQNWKIKKMSYQELIGQSKAVNSMLYYYQRGRDFPSVCQLCKVSKTYHPRVRPTCVNCLWMIIEGTGCCEFAITKFHRIVDISLMTRTKQWHELRIPMLRRWGRIIKAEMDSRTEGGGG